MADITDPNDRFIARGIAGRAVSGDVLQAREAIYGFVDSFQKLFREYLEGFFPAETAERILATLKREGVITE